MTARQRAWAPEDYEGAAAQCGREVLAVDRRRIDSGRPGTAPDHRRVRQPLPAHLVHFEDATDQGSLGAVATITSDDLADPSSEIAAVEFARDAKLHAQHLGVRADEKQEEALFAARAVGNGANALARLVDGAVSRPIARRMMR